MHRCCLLYSVSFKSSERIWRFVGNGVLTGGNGLLEKLDSLFLARKAVALLVVQPAQLLQDLGMVGVPVQHTLVGILGTVEVLLLLVDMANLEPDILLGQRRRWGVDDVLEALETLVILLLLLVYDSQAEVDFVGLLEVWLHLHDLGKGLLGMVQGTITIVQNADAVP